MKMLRNFWNDESGAVLSAEMVTVGTVAVLGTMTGLQTVSKSVNDELSDYARAIRCLDQSYAINGFSSCRSWTAGSCFNQAPVAVSLQTICAGSIVPVPAVVVPVPGQIVVPPEPAPAVLPAPNPAPQPPVEGSATPATDKL